MFIFKPQGALKVTSMERDLEYLTVGEVYDYQLDGNHVSFRRVSNGGGTFAKLIMLDIFQKQGRIAFAEVN